MRRLLLYLFITVGLLYALREIVYIGIRANTRGEFDKLNTAFREQHHFDILIIGSSRAECQLYTPIIEKTMNLRTYNLGMMGATLPFISHCYKAFRENSGAPKLLLLLADVHSLGDPIDSIYHYPRYFPYLSNSALYNGLNQLDPRFKYFRWNAMYSLAHLSDKYKNAAVRGFTGQPGVYDLRYSGGYSPCLSVANDSIFYALRPNNYPSQLPDHFVTALHELQSHCTKDSTRLIVLLAPVHSSFARHLPNYDARVKDLQKLCHQLGVTCIDPSDQHIMDRRNLYADPEHYNTTGALLYSLYTAKFLATAMQ